MLFICLACMIYEHTMLVTFYFLVYIGYILLLMQLWHFLIHCVTLQTEIKYGPGLQKTCL